jgi:predicted DNA-binding transcriptional regulator YafY
MRGDKSIRLLKEMMYLNSRFGKTLPDLQEFLAEEGIHVHTRTIRRDLTELEAAGLWVEVTRRDDGDTVYRIEGDLKIETKFNLREIAALIFSLKKMQTLQISPFGADLESVLDKILAQTPPRVAKIARELHYAFEPLETQMKSYLLPADESKVLVLTEAIYRRQALHLVYENIAGGHKEYDVWPMKMVQFRGSLYVYTCRPGAADAPFVCAVDRILEIRKLDDRYDENSLRQASTKIALMRERAFGLVDDGILKRYRITIAARLARYIAERKWHPTQKITKRKDGSVLLEFTASGAYEVDAWIRYLGDAVLKVERKEVSE